MDGSFFLYESFEAFLRRAQTVCRVTSLGSWDGGPALILRHDVDYDITSALRLAEIEERVGVRSTFFIRLTGSAYNPFSEQHRRDLRDLHDRGFEIGLHLDPSAYDSGSVERGARAEADLLSLAVGADVVSVSIHNPSVHGSMPLFPHLRNAYDPAIFDEGRYVSDSLMRFRSDPEALIARAASEPCQLLLHPMHFSEAGDGYRAQVTRIFDRFAEHLHAEMRVNETYLTAVPGPLRLTID